MLHSMSRYLVLAAGVLAARADQALAHGHFADSHPAVISHRAAHRHHEADRGAVGGHPYAGVYDYAAATSQDRNASTQPPYVYRGKEHGWRAPAAPDAQQQDAFPYFSSGDDRSAYRERYSDQTSSGQYARASRNAGAGARPYDSAQPSFDHAYGQGFRQGSALDGMVAEMASANGVPLTLARRVIQRESGGNPRAVSAGNYGLMQIRLGTARAMGYGGSAAGLLDPATNMTYAMRYLGGAYQAAGGNESYAVALYSRGYNAARISGQGSGRSGPAGSYFR